MEREQQEVQRRDRVAAAALRVVTERGIEGLSHQAVAAVADVPLESTTNEFATRDDLIGAALERAADDFVADKEAMVTQLAAQNRGIGREDLAGMLADGVLGYCFGPNRDRAVVDYELNVAAMRRSAMRRTTSRYFDSSVAALSQLVDQDTAVAVGTLVNGLNLRLLLTSEPPPREELLPIISRVLT